LGLRRMCEQHLLPNARAFVEIGSFAWHGIGGLRRDISLEATRSITQRRNLPIKSLQQTWKSMNRKEGSLANIGMDPSETQRTLGTLRFMLSQAQAAMYIHTYLVLAITAHLMHQKIH
jgi:hypothetical protein